MGKIKNIVATGLVFLMLRNANTSYAMNNDETNLSILLSVDEITAVLYGYEDSLDGFNMKRSDMFMGDVSDTKYVVDVTDLNGNNRLAICEATIGNYKTWGPETIKDIVTYVEIMTGQIIAQCHENNVQDNCSLCLEDGGSVPLTVNGVYVIPNYLIEGLMPSDIYEQLRDGKINFIDLEPIDITSQKESLGK